MKRLSIVGLCLMLLSLFGCRKDERSTSSSALAETLVGEAHKTHIAYVKGRNHQGVEIPYNIPSVYWADGIRTLDPACVYLHKGNVVVVQTDSDGVERGKYICIPISSYLPMTGEDGFTFRPDPRKGDTFSPGRCVFDFERKVHD